MWSLSALWHLLLSSATISTLIGCAAVAVAVLLPKQLDFVTDLRKWAIVVAVCAFGYSFTFSKGFSNGLAVKQSEWDLSLVKEAGDGEKARADAERVVGPESADRRMFDNDSFNRDRGSK